LEGVTKIKAKTEIIILTMTISCTYLVIFFFFASAFLKTRKPQNPNPATNTLYLETLKSQTTPLC